MNTLHLPRSILRLRIRSVNTRRRPLDFGQWSYRFTIQSRTYLTMLHANFDYLEWHSNHTALSMAKQCLLHPKMDLHSSGFAIYPSEVLFAIQWSVSPNRANCRSITPGLRFLSNPPEHVPLYLSAKSLKNVYLRHGILREEVYLQTRGEFIYNPSSGFIAFNRCMRLGVPSIHSILSLCQYCKSSDQLYS